MNDKELMKKKNACIRTANAFQMKADKWYGLAKEYNDELVRNWIKRFKKKEDRG